MTPFVEATVETGEVSSFADEVIKQVRSGEVPISALLNIGERLEDMSDESLRARITEQVTEEIESSKVYLNDTYQVHVRRMIPNAESAPMMVHLSIKRIDRQCIHDWRELQEIKNQLVGVDCEGVELYPAQERVVDTANQYHLWVIDDPTFRFPWGFSNGCVTDTPVGKSVNRPFKKT